MWIICEDNTLVNMDFVAAIRYKVSEDKTAVVFRDSSRYNICCGDATDRIIDGLNRDTKIMGVN